MLNRLGYGVTILALAILFPFQTVASVPSGTPESEITAAPLSLVSDNTEMSSLSFDLGRVGLMTESDVNDRSRYAIEGEPNTPLEGWPELPMVTRLVIIPPRGGVEVVINNVQSRIEWGNDVFIVPRQDGSENLNISGREAEEYRSTDEFWPAEVVRVGEPAILRGYRLVQVTIHPVQYNRSTGAMKFNDVIDFDLVYGGTGVNEVMDPDRARPSSSVHKVLQSLTINPPRRDNPDKPERGSYLLIYPDVDGVEEALQPLIEWRARQGWEVHVEEVNNGAQASSVKRDVTQVAYDEWDNPPEMITLVGDGGGTVAIGAFAANNNAYEDLSFVRLDGNDILADADIGRLSVESVRQLEYVVEKLVNYEANPYMEDTLWYNQGMVCAGYAGSGLSTILINRWVARELRERGFDGEEGVHEWYFNDRFENQSVPQFFQSEYARGIAFSNYRGWIGIEGTSPQAVMGYRDRDGMFPASIILTCGSGNWYAGILGMNEAMFRSEGGGIGGVGLQTSATHVQFNNALSVGVWVGFLKEELYTFGTAINRGRYELYRQYNGHDDGSVTNFSYWTQFMGDPATHVWTGVPQGIVVDHQATLSLGASRLTVSIASEENEAAYEGAIVCLYKPDDEFQVTAYSDNEGVVEFALPTDALNEGELMVTVTDHNIIPYLGAVEIGEAEYYLGAESWIIDEDDDDNGEANPGETIGLTVALHNFGTELPDGEVTVDCKIVGDWAEVTSDPVVLDEAPASGAAVDVSVTLEVDDSAPDGEILLVAVDAAVGEVTYGSVVPVEVSAPRIEIKELYFSEEFEPGTIVNLDIELENTGSYDLSTSSVRLWSESIVATVVDNEAQYDDLEAGNSNRIDGRLFRIRAHPLTIPGMDIDLKLAIESEDGFRDTTTYTFQIGEPGVTDPFGPDGYGYVCFDSDDEEWEISPVYDWIEIDDEEDWDFRGEDTELRDTSEDNDKSIAIDLPFVFQYYGVEFDQITVCTNGWVAFGNWVKLVDFRNRRIASGGGPNAQLCVFWDNLTTGKISTFYDEEGGRFIVEWNNMRRLWSGGGNETFELILFEQWAEPTYTEDGVILFQYKEIENASGNDAAGNDTPYATVGIGNLDDTDGLEYTYWNRYHPGAKRLEDEMAIKFSTATHFITGVLTGTVTDARTNEPIEGAQIFTTRGFWGESDADGRYSIDEILVGEGYLVTASAQGYNDSTKANEEDDGGGYDIAEAETTFVDFVLLHPEFNIDIREFGFVLKPDSTTYAEIQLSNDGNGPLDYTSRYIYVLEEAQENNGREDLREVRRDDSDEAWDQLLEWNVTAETQSYRIGGITYVGDEWYVTGTGSEVYENYFYIFDRWGEYERTIEQPEGSRYGVRDMEYYDGSLYCATNANYLSRIDPETGEELNRWSTAGEIRATNTITLSPDGYIYTSAITQSIRKFEISDDTLALVETLDPRDPRDDGSIYKYGLTWFRDDPDGYNLYIYGSISLNEADVSLFKMNPETEDVMFVTDLNFPVEGNYNAKGGVSLTPKWNNLVWAFAAIIDHPGGDLAAIYELAPNSSWINYDPREGHLDADEDVTIELSLTTADLDTGMYGVVIEYTHNAYDGVTLIPVDLEVRYPDLAPENTAIPLEYSLSQNYPNPFNPLTSIAYSLREAGLTSLKLYDALGREVTTLVDSRQSAGRYRVNVDGHNLATGIYFYRIESGEFSSVRKMVLMK